MIQTEKHISTPLDELAQLIDSTDLINDINYHKLNNVDLRTLMNLEHKGLYILPARTFVKNLSRGESMALYNIITKNLKTSINDSERGESAKQASQEHQ